MNITGWHAACGERHDINIGCHELERFPSDVAKGPGYTELCGAYEAGRGCEDNFCNGRKPDEPRPRPLPFKTQAVIEGSCSNCKGPFSTEAYTVEIQRYAVMSDGVIRATNSFMSGNERRGAFHQVEYKVCRSCIYEVKRRAGGAEHDD